MSSRRVRVAISGLGRMGQRHALNLLCVAEIVCVYDANPHVAPWVATHLPGATFVSSFTELVAFPTVELVWIACSTPLHASQAVEAIEAGKHVFIEKPLSIRLDEARRVADVAAHHPKQLVVVGYSRRFDESYRDAHSRIQQGEVGQPFMLRSHTADLALPEDAVMAYNAQSGGIFVDCLIHDIDLALWLLSPTTDKQGLLRPNRVWATGTTAVYHKMRDNGDVDNALGTIEWSNGAITQLYGSRTQVHAHDCATEIQGPDGKLLINTVPSSSRLQVASSSGLVTPLQHCWTERFSAAFEEEARQVVSAVARLLDDPQATPEPPAGLTLASAVRGLEIATALQTSLRQAREIRFDERGAPLLETPTFVLPLDASKGVQPVTLLAANVNSAASTKDVHGPGDSNGRLPTSASAAAMA
ncbi:hypothetical protein ACQY0O_005752 [Thecaphora frezii]